MSKTYVKIPAGGRPETLTVTSEARELRVLQEAVGGHICSADAPEGHTLYVHDEGLLIGLPLNFLATQLSGQYLVGDAVLVGPVDSEGETAGVDPRFIDLLVTS